MGPGHVPVGPPRTLVRDAVRVPASMSYFAKLARGRVTRFHYVKRTLPAVGGGALGEQKGPSETRTNIPAYRTPEGEDEEPLTYPPQMVIESN